MPMLTEEQIQIQTPPPAEKKCPFCAETIRIEAIKCRHCGEFLDRPARRKGSWKFSTPAVVLGLLTLGPLALPLVWFNPRWKPVVKTIITTGIIALTGLLCWASAAAYSSFLNRITALGL